MWVSKVSSVAFAVPEINEAHADVSSAAAEIYAAANAANEFLHLSYVIEELGMNFPKPFKLRIDNTAAITFVKGTCFKTNLKHIDCRQEWVRCLRDKNIMQPIYVKTTENYADLFTKILGPQTFDYLRGLVMYRYKHD